MTTPTMPDPERTGSPSRGVPVSLLAFVNVVLRHRRLVIGCAVLALGAAVVLTLIHPRTYTSSASFMPQSPRQGSMAQLAGIASQFGFALPTLPSGESPYFYVDLLHSREILGAVVDRTYTTPSPDGPRRVNLIEWLEADGRGAAERREDAIRKLREKIDLIVLARSGVVRMEVESRSPHLAQAIGTALLAQLDRFNLEGKQGQAGAERRFTEQRAREAEQELRDSEDQLRRFLSTNREFAGSPQLTFEHGRLERQVMLRQQIYLSLAQAYEQARIDEVRDTPVLTVVEAPDLPVEPDRRFLITRGLVGLLVGGVIGISLALMLDFRARLRRAAAPELAEFGLLRDQLLREVRRPAEFFRRTRLRAHRPVDTDPSPTDSAS